MYQGLWQALGLAWDPKKARALPSKFLVSTREDEAKHKNGSALSDVGSSQDMLCMVRVTKAQKRSPNFTKSEKRYLISCLPLTQEGRRRVPGVCKVA